MARPRSSTTSRSDKPISRWTEDDLYEEIRKACKQIGLIPEDGTYAAPGFGFVYHTHDSRRSTSGFPDICLINRWGAVLWVELKRDGELLSPAQEIVVGLLRAGGHNVQVWRPADWASHRIQHELAAFRSRRPHRGDHAT